MNEHGIFTSTIAARFISWIHLFSSGLRLGAGASQRLPTARVTPCPPPSLNFRDGPNVTVNGLPAAAATLVSVTRFWKQRICQVSSNHFFRHRPGHLPRKHLTPVNWWTKKIKAKTPGNLYFTFWHFKWNPENWMTGLKIRGVHPTAQSESTRQSTSIPGGQTKLRFLTQLKRKALLSHSRKTPVWLIHMAFKKLT